MKNKGFTLVEIVVTVAILTVLLAVGVPGLMSYFDDTHEKKILNDANAVLNVAKTYNESNKASLEGRYKASDFDVNSEMNQEYLTDIEDKADVNGNIIKITYKDRKVVCLIYHLDGQYAIYDQNTNQFRIEDQLPQDV